MANSARLEVVGTLERKTLPVPYGQRVYVVSDLDLRPNSPRPQRGVRQLIELLDDSDDPTVVIVAGNFFAPTEDAEDYVTFLRELWRAHSDVRASIQRFTHGEGRQLILLGGFRDQAMISADAVRVELAHLAIEVASDVMLHIGTAQGVREVSVVAGQTDIASELADVSERPEAARLEDPSAAARFAASRLLYRRLGRWVWLPVWGVVVVDLAASIIQGAAAVTHRHVRVHLHTHPPSVFASILINLVTIAFVEAVLAGIAGVIIRRRFVRRDTAATDPQTRDILSHTLVNGTPAIEYASRIGSRGGGGAIVGGASRPALAFLSAGVCASPGPSRRTVVERRGRFGLPPTFVVVDRFAMIELEAAASVHARLIGGDTQIPRGTLLERLVSGSARLPGLSQETLVVGAWPSANPWPIQPETTTDQRRETTIRRLASYLLMLTGFFDILIGLRPPLRGHLNSVLTFLPLGLDQSVGAVTAIGGVALVMLARGVRRGQRQAWTVAVLLLAVTTVVHFLRSSHITTTIASVVVLVVMVVARERFSATTDRGSVRSVVPRLGLAALLSVIAATVGVVFSYRHHHFNLPWWRVFLACAERLVGITTLSLPDTANDFTTAVMECLGAALIGTIIYLATRPVVDRRLSEGANTAERRLAELRARDIVRRHGHGSLDYFALRDDKQFYFFRDSLVAYAVYGGVAAISPDPIGPRAERGEVFRNFRAFAQSRGWTIAVVAADSTWLPIYRENGLHSLYLGDEAIVDCQRFSLEGGRMKGLRQACTRLERKGYTVEFRDPATIDTADAADILELITKLRRGDGERGFSMMLGRLFYAKDKGLLLTIVRGPDGVPAAVCQFVPGAAAHSYSLDLMRRDPGEHPNGLLDYALCSTIAYIAQRGGRNVSLNFAAFRSVLDGERGEGTFTRIERWGLKRLSGILPIETLWSFNNKYYPTWYPRHLVYPGVESFVPVVAAILRAESLTEIPLVGRFFANDPANRPGTVVPPEIVAAAHAASSHSRDD